MSDKCSHPRRYKKRPCKGYRTVQLLPEIPGTAGSSGKGWAARVALGLPGMQEELSEVTPGLLTKLHFKYKLTSYLTFFFLCIVTNERRGNVFPGVAQKGEGISPLPEHHLPPHPGPRSPSPGGQVVPLALMSGQSPFCFV